MNKWHWILPGSRFIFGYAVCAYTGIGAVISSVFSIFSSTGTLLIALFKPDIFLPYFVGVLGWITANYLSKFFVDQLLEFRRLRADVSATLIYCANVTMPSEVPKNADDYLKIRMWDSFLDAGASLRVCPESL